MKKLILVLAVALAACATKPEIRYVPQEVKVPVPVKCKAPNIAKPTYDFNNAKKTNTLYTSIGLLAAENDHLSAYTIKLEAALAACTK
jgi:hypothetical protein